MNKQRLLILMSIVILIITGCDLSEQRWPTRYHVVCYQLGTVIFDKVLIRMNTHLPGEYWADEETGYGVIVPERGGASCVFEGLPEKDESQ